MTTTSFVVAVIAGAAAAHSWFDVDAAADRLVIGTALGLVVSGVVTAAGAGWAQGDYARPHREISGGVHQGITGSVIISRGDGPAIGNYNGGPASDRRKPWNNRG